MMPLWRQSRMVNGLSFNVRANSRVSSSSPFPWRMNFVRGLFFGSFAICQRALPNLRLIYKKKSVLTTIYQFKLQMAETPIGKRQRFGNEGFFTY